MFSAKTRIPFTLYVLMHRVLTQLALRASAVQNISAHVIQPVGGMVLVLVELDVIEHFGS